jgi:hypothetical protein
VSQDRARAGYPGSSASQITRAGGMAAYPIADSGLMGWQALSVPMARRALEPRWCMRGISKMQRRWLQKLRQRELTEKQAEEE